MVSAPIPSLTMWNPQIPLFEVLSHLPEPHIRVPLDLVLGFGNILFIKLVLWAPHTGGWALFRMGIATPICLGIFTYLVLCQIEKDDVTHWGASSLCFMWSMRVLEYFVFYPPEEHVHRIVPKSQIHPHPKKLSDVQKAEQEETGEETLVPEPVPRPFTLAKFYWGSSLTWSFRGIGWNFQCPLPASSTSAPYSRGSSRSSWIKAQLKPWFIIYIIDDLCRALRNIVAKEFFAGEVPYDSLTQWQRGLYSTLVVFRVYAGMVHAWIPYGIGMFTIGWMMGWKGEIWEPWGWPPLFGPMGDLWKHPGLSTMWSRTWHGYNRRWLYVLGWVGIGENLLGLTHTGVSTHPSVPSISGSGTISPSHPIPSSTSGSGSSSNKTLPTRKISSKLIFQNLIKSFITFLLSGLNHDIGSLALIIKNHPRSHPVYLNELFRLTPFFVLQPVGLAFEALIKHVYRSSKKRYIQRGMEPNWLIFLERLVGFVWTWTWLGWSARYFVEGMVMLGAYRRDGGRDLYWSLWGGLVWGKWMI
ncbi:hypothetical protein I302_108824 [Kwoniella bestiolae CBS 10118]|uniref:Wax synthase domain-containing protein n=1 Tax=Kwoniella bestiolae CBS 10118 TaxID=1296100 RepID=A0A1B9FU81_9TREE|nr:hypothetical protein I302_07963 [Kwoniella bestiolae CBS 10118]OCF22316.1 hypothetical protein I302_07963 [Kwoniella bestiolae CBS 10118]